MNTKYFLAAVITTLALGACGEILNSQDQGNKTEQKTKSKNIMLKLIKQNT